MAPIHNFGVLAFASAVLAVPHAHHQPLRRHAHPAAPPAYGGSSSAAPVSSIPAYESSSVASASSAYSIPVYESASSADPTLSSYGIPSYSSASSAEPASSGSWSIPAYGSSASGSYSIPSYPSGSSAEPASSGSWSIPAYGSSSSAAPVSSVPSYPSSGVYPTTSVCTETTTKIYRSTTEYSTYYVTHTIYATKSGSEAAAVPSGWGSSPVDPATYAASAPAYETAPASAAPTYDGASTCAADVTVTTTEKTTVYVTLGASSAAAIPSYTIPNKGYSEAAPSGYPAGSAAPAPSYGAPAPSYGAPAPSSYSAPEPSSAPSSSGGYSGKRGLAYNDASLCNAFAGTGATGWAYNWGSDSSGLDSSIPYIPMLWGPASQFSSNWAEKAKAAIAGGAQYLFSFNEPDMSSQSNLSPQAAAEAWKTYMEPFAGQAKLVAPSVTNGQDASMGLGWLQQFLDACSGCTIDAYAQHWYFPTNDVDNFKDQISKASSLGGGKPVFVSEFGAIGSDEDKSAFLKEVLPWMDSNDSVAGYSYFMVADGMLNSGSGLSAYGETYASA